MIKTSITVSGITFSSIKEAAAHFKQNYGTVLVRLRNLRWTVEEAFGVKQHKKRHKEQSKKLVTSDGTFNSFREAANHFGINYPALLNRLALGWTPDQAVGIEPHRRPPRKNKEVPCAGKAYPNAWALARAYDKKEGLVAKRLTCGWTPEQAVEIEEAPPRFRNQPNGATNKHWKKIEIVDEKEYPATGVGDYKLYLIMNKVDGKQYVGITINPLWQRFNGHKRSARIGVKSKLYNAMRHYGDENFSIELLRSDAKSFVELQQQEMEEIIRRDAIKNGYNVSPGGSIGTPMKITVGGISFPSNSAAANYFGIDPTVFSMRLVRLGWTPEQAAEIKPREKYSRNKIKLGGVTYPSIRNAAEVHSLDYRVVWRRIKNLGWTVEQALGILPPPKKLHKKTCED